MTACALWYMRYHSAYYMLADSERDAAASAYWMIDDGGGSPMGVQFPDRRTLHIDEWPAFEAYQRDREVEEAEARNHPVEPHPTRTILDPFQGQRVDVEIDAPAWLGKQSGSAEPGH